MAGTDTFREYLAQLHYSPRSVTIYDRYARRADRWFRARGRSLARATETELRDWWCTLPTSASSRNGARYALLAWYRWRGRRDGGPARYLDRIPAPIGLPRPIPEADYLTLMATATSMGGVWAALVGLLGYTGCRIGEATRARWSQIDLRDAVWMIEGKGGRRRGPKYRIVPLHPVLVAHLAAWQAESGSADWVFPSPVRPDAPLSAKTLSRRLAEVAAEAAVARQSAHKYRHAVATLGVRRTGDLEGTRKLLGHASLATTQVYVERNAEDLRALVGSLG